MALDEKVEKELKWARKCAEIGDARSMEDTLFVAEKYAKNAGQDIPAQAVAQIEKIGYETAVPVQLAGAMEYAKQGKGRLMEDCLLMAGRYAHKAGQNISPQVAEIRAMVGY